MARIATVNYHVRSSARPAYQIDAGGVVGKLVSPEHAETTVEVKDVRNGETAVSFSDDAVMFERLPTGVASFGDDNRRYAGMVPHRWGRLLNGTGGRPLMEIKGRFSLFYKIFNFRFT